MRHFTSQGLNAFYPFWLFFFLFTLLLLTWQNLTLAKASREADIFYRPLPEQIALAVHWEVRFRADQDLEQALHSGVPLDFVLEIEGLERGLFGGKIFRPVLQRRYRLLYHNLAQQYVVIDLSADRLENFRRLDTALAYFNEEKILPLPIDKLVLHDAKSRPRYRGRLRFRFDNNSLPLLLRGANVFSQRWTLQSPWRAWSWPE